VITIQKARLSDLTGIRRLLIYTWIQTYRGVFSAKITAKAIPVWYGRKLLSSQLRDPSILFNIARNEKEKIVGIVAASRVNQRTLLIRRLYVHPAYQRRHIGKKLMDIAIRSFYGVKRVRLEVVRENRKARYFYLRHGFKFIKTNKVSLNGMSLLLIVMEKGV